MGDVDVRAEIEVALKAFSKLFEFCLLWRRRALISSDLLVRQPLENVRQQAIMFDLVRQLVGQTLVGIAIDFAVDLRVKLG
jgi:hypothetical protein